MKKGNQMTSPKIVLKLSIQKKLLSTFVIKSYSKITYGNILKESIVFILKNPAMNYVNWNEYWLWLQSLNHTYLDTIFSCFQLFLFIPTLTICRWFKLRTFVFKKSFAQMYVRYLKANVYGLLCFLSLTTLGMYVIFSPNH